MTFWIKVLDEQGILKRACDVNPFFHRKMLHLFNVYV